MHPTIRPRWPFALVFLAALAVTGCGSYRSHAEYPPHYHDKNTMPHHVVPYPPAPPHNHHHSQTKATGKWAKGKWADDAEVVNSR